MRRVEYLSVDIVRSLCPECADIMEQRNIKSLRADNLPPSLKAAIKEKLGTAQSGFFERCMGHDFGRSFSNKEAFCAWLRKRVTGKWPSERSASIVGKSDITKADYPLGTLKLLAQTMPKEIRALRLSHAKLVSAMTVLSHIDVPEAQDAMRDLRYIDGLVKTGIDTTTQQWKAISQQLRARGENASDIVPLYGRSASMKLRFGFGPLIVNINSEGERRKAQAQLDSVEAAIRQLQPLVRNGGQLLSSTQRALEFLQGAMDYADNAEQTIPGTQFGQLVARYGIAVRKVSSMYQILKQRITEARQELEQLDKTARQLELALAKF